MKFQHYAGEPTKYGSHFQGTLKELVRDSPSPHQQPSLMGSDNQPLTTGCAGGFLILSQAKKYALIEWECNKLGQVKLSSNPHAQTRILQLEHFNIINKHLIWLTYLATSLLSLQGDRFSDLVTPTLFEVDNSNCVNVQSKLWRQNQRFLHIPEIWKCPAPPLRKQGVVAINNLELTKRSHEWNIT